MLLLVHIFWCTCSLLSALSSKGADLLLRFVRAVVSVWPRQRCKLAPQNRLTCPAKGRYCGHVACCNWAELRALVANSTHSRKPSCPVAGCSVKLRLEKDLVRDQELASALNDVPAGQEFSLSLCIPLGASQQYKI